MSISCKKSRPMFVLTFLLKGGLYHITFRRLAGLVELLLLSRFGSYVKSVLTKLLRFKASLYKGAASLNVASLTEAQAKTPRVPSGLLNQLLLSFSEEGYFSRNCLVVVNGLKKAFTVMYLFSI